MYIDEHVIDWLSDVASISLPVYLQFFTYVSDYLFVHIVIVIVFLFHHVAWCTIEGEIDWCLLTDWRKKSIEIVESKVEWIMMMLFVKRL